MTQILLYILSIIHPFDFTPLKVKKELTPLTEVQVVSALREGHIEEFGFEPKKHRLEVATAQVFLENSRGKLIYCNNFGMIGAGRHEKYFMISGHKMRALSSPTEGAKAYWHAIRTGHYGVLRWFDVGNVVGAAESLTKSGYHRSDPDFYKKLLSDLYPSAVRAVEAK